MESKIKTFLTALFVFFLVNTGIAAGFGTLDVRVNDPGDRTEYIDFTSALVEEDFKIFPEGNAGNGNGQFAAHITGFDLNKDGIDQDDQNVFVRAGAPIPEPGTMILLGISLITAAGYMRRLSKNEK